MAVRLLVILSAAKDLPSEGNAPDREILRLASLAQDDTEETRIATTVCALSRNDRRGVSITQRYLEAVRDEQVLTSARKTGVLANL